ncbi:polysaccharide lyase 6 family protein [Polaribacter sargassicola]|uniref:polysaccharide lyase 6 family protein n=1 Tax=Polaribacter sargassicola TaxID=2836891 RepID=UPI001F461321|nr:polysaccharide lyase 6 family protein [Polaribacter sp. DS7-9]MCG1037387.1 polysaccharide lyase 6 family protein [Polaribacter sp. DS7-9]
MNKIVFIIISVLSFSTLKVNAQEVLVSNIVEYNASIKNAKPGTTIILKNGIWKDVKLNAYGNGEEDNPIIVKAETAGKVIVSGNSTLNIYGEYVIVSGLWFKDGSSSYKSVVQFKKDSKTFANNCRLTNSAITYFENNAGLKDHWVDIWGKNNRVDHNNFTGKTSEGTTLVVWLKGDEHVENNHRIDNNFFGEREDLGKNGGETIRIGTSENSMKSSKTLVERNIFANCDGEIEIVSNKSCDNIFRDNLFVESKGTLTLRHGNNALVERNVFIGNGVSNTGGIRVINQGHIIKNNYLIGLEGDGYRGPIVVMNGVPNTPLNRYLQVKNVDIQNNTIINSGPITFGAGKDEEKTLAPVSTNFSNNLIFNTKSDKNIIFEDSVDGVTFSNNYLDAPGSETLNGFNRVKVEWKEIGSFPIPTANNSALLEVSKNDKSATKDITNSSRVTFNAGAFNLDANRLPKALTLRSGPGWKVEIVKPVAKAEEISVEPGVETLRKAINKANPGSILMLKTGEYILEKSIKVSKNIKIIGDKGGATIITAKKDLEKPLSYMFRVNEEVTLDIKNVILDGEISNLKYAIVSPDKQEAGIYNLFVENVTFKNFTNKSGGSVFKAYNGTKADTLSFINSRFEDNYRGLNLSYDKDEMGKFNANNIIIENTVFKNIEEAAINYYRKILSPELPGGNLIIKNSVFSNVYNDEKGKIIRSEGIHNVEITNSVFEGSYKIETPISLKGTKNVISNCLIFKSGFVKVSNGAEKENLIYKNPKWEDDILFIPSEKSDLLKSNNGVENIGLKQ